MITQKKQLLFEKQAEIVKAIAHPLRIAIVDFLKDGEQCVCDIAEHIGSERSNVSRHLSVMVNAGVLGYHKDGLKVIYRWAGKVNGKNWSLSLQYSQAVFTCRLDLAVSIMRLRKPCILLNGMPESMYCSAWFRLFS